MDLEKDISSPFEDCNFVTENIGGNILSITWKGFCNPEDYQYGFLKAVELARDKKSHKLLLDFKDIKVISPENQKWTAAVLIKKFNRIGIKKIAVLRSACPLANASVECIHEDFEPSIAYTRRVFAYREEAEQWLRENDDVGNRNKK